MSRVKKELNRIRLLKTLIDFSAAAVVGVDFGTTSIKVAEISWRSGKPCLKAVGLSEGASTETERLPERLGSLLVKAGVTARKAVFSVDGKNCFSKKLSYPKMSLKELRAAVSWDLEKHVPYEKGSYYFDTAPLSASRDADVSEVLLVAAPKRSVDRRTALIKAVGLRPLAADLEVLALKRTIALDDCILLDLGGAATKTYVYKNGCPVLQRRLMPLKAKQTDVFYETERLAEEVKGALQYCENHGAALEMKKIIVCGGAQSEKVILQLSGLLDCEVERHEPLTGVNVSAVLSKEYLSDITSRLSVALGLALRGGEAD